MIRLLGPKEPFKCMCSKSSTRRSLLCSLPASSSKSSSSSTILSSSLVWVRSCWSVVPLHISGSTTTELVDSHRLISPIEFVRAGGIVWWLSICELCGWWWECETRTVGLKNWGLFDYTRVKEFTSTVQCTQRSWLKMSEFKVVNYSKYRHSLYNTWQLQ